MISKPSSFFFRGAIAPAEVLKTFLFEEFAALSVVGVSIIDYFNNCQRL